MMNFVADYVSKLEIYSTAKAEIKVRDGVKMSVNQINPQPLDVPD